MNDPSSDTPSAHATDPAAPALPPGFRPLSMGGEFIGLNGPIYLLHQGSLVQLGFRVEARHTNPMGNCHGGWLASFADKAAAHLGAPQIA